MGKHNAYSKEVVEFIRENVSGRTAEELSILVNEKFGTNFDKNKMKSFKQNYKIRSGREHLKGMKKETELYPKEVLEFILQNYKGKGHSEMAKTLNEKFGTKYTAMQIKAFYGSRKLDSGITGHFPPGNVPFTKGKKGFYSKGSEKGWFEKGHTPLNKLPIGSVVKKTDGYLWRKIGEGSRDWKQEHILRWEEKNGPSHGDFYSVCQFINTRRQFICVKNNFFCHIKFLLFLFQNSQYICFFYQDIIMTVNFNFVHR